MSLATSVGAWSLVATVSLIVMTGLIAVVCMSGEATTVGSSLLNIVPAA